jgi:hypothetical protein
MNACDRIEYTLSRLTKIDATNFLVGIVEPEGLLAA